MSVASKISIDRLNKQFTDQKILIGSRRYTPIQIAASLANFAKVTLVYFCYPFWTFYLHNQQ